MDAARLLFAFPLLPHASWEIGIDAAAAAVTMGSYLLAQHPVLRRSFTAIPMGEE